MDKETLSNYGWIVIAVLVLAVMIALASPFGHFIENGVKSTAQGLFDVNQSAGAIAGLDIPNQELGMPATNNGSNNTTQNNGAGATFDTNFDGINDVTLTWSELQLEENGETYMYNADCISDTGLNRIYPDDGGWCDSFYMCPYLTSITIPDTVTFISQDTFSETFYLTSINYLGTVTQWNSITLEDKWYNSSLPATYVQCSDGQVPLS